MANASVERVCFVLRLKPDRVDEYFADCVGWPVVAGPAEATAIGNVLVQARARGLLRGDLEDLRGNMATTLAGMRFEPRRAPAGRV